MIQRYIYHVAGGNSFAYCRPEDVATLESELVVVKAENVRLSKVVKAMETTLPAHIRRAEKEIELKFKAENEKLRIILYEEWFSHKLDTIEEYYDMPQVQAKEIFDNWLKQKLEEK